MNQWNFYLSGILYGVFEKRDGRVYHRTLDVYTGRLMDWRELTPEDTWYLELGRMNVREALMRLDEYETGVRKCLGTPEGGLTGEEGALTRAKDGLARPEDGLGVDGCVRFTTSHGEVFEKKNDTSFVQRHIKFPKDLVIKFGSIAAFVTPYRDQCAVLVRDGLEDCTILTQWDTINRSPLYAVTPPVTAMIPMRDHVCLAADIYLPAAVQAADGNCVKPVPEQIPAVLIRTPYGKGSGKAAYLRFVQRGYAVVIQDVRGREDSQGEWLPMYYEVEDGDDTLNWIAAQPWSDGNVGMTGGSYLGYVQWAAAASGNPHLKAMLSSVCAGSPFIDVPRRGGCFNSGMLAWAFMVSGQRANPELMARDDWDEVLNIRPLKDLAPKALGYDIPFLKKWFDHMDYDELWQRGNWKERTGSHRVPALIMSGWFDDNGMGTTEALELYHDYKEKKVILGPWMHTGNADYDIHGFALGNNALRYDMDLICLSWLEHYLKGVDNGIDRTPTVEYYTMGANQWKIADNWPVPGTSELCLYLDGGYEDAAAENKGRLSAGAPLIPSSDSYVYDPKNPAVHLVDMSENELEVPSDYAAEEQRPDILCYSTGILTQDLTITGDVSAKLYLSSDCEDTDLVVRITDVDENGRSMKLADGVISARYRNQFEHPDFMEPGMIYPVTIRTTKLSHTFLKGHQLRVTITSGASNFIFPNRNTRDGFNSVEMRTAHNCIHRGGKWASRVILQQE